MKKTTHDQMKLRQSDKKEVRDQGTNTEISDEKDSFIESQPLPTPEERQTGSKMIYDKPMKTVSSEEHQNGSGMIYDKPVKRKSPPGMRTPPPKKKKNLDQILNVLLNIIQYDIPCTILQSCNKHVKIIINCNQYINVFVVNSHKARCS